MDNNNMPKCLGPEAFGADQLKAVLIEIAGSAYSALNLCSQAITTDDCSAQAAQLTGVEALVQKIGWLADHHGAHTHGTAVDWMMPPTYRCGTIEAGGES